MLNIHSPRFKKSVSTLVLAGLLVPAAPLRAAASVTAVWANNGEDKVTQDELRAASGGPGVLNSVWDGGRVNLFGARNETVAFNLVIEARSAAASGVSVSFDRLEGPNGSVIASSPASGDGVFDWTARPIELFHVRYLKVKGLSQMSYETYDERHVPKRLRRPWSGAGKGTGLWTDRPDRDKNYPDIAVPLELAPSFAISAGTNQSVWADVTIPKTAEPGLYTGTLTVREAGTVVADVPVRLDVRAFTLPDAPSAKTMLYYSSDNINKRYLGSASVSPGSAQGLKARLLRDRHFLLAHRHRISLIGDDAARDCGDPGDRPCPEWQARLDGSLFTAANGYGGPGVNVGNNVYSIGTYGSWAWKGGTQSDMNSHTDAWAGWFNANAPAVERFLYLIDESADTAQIETWARWILNNPGPGRALKSMATIALPTAVSQSPSLDIPVSTLGAAVHAQWQPLADAGTSDPRKRFFMYNGHRPATGSFATEDDGVALRELAWSHYKKRINRWFFWESTYYNNFQGGTGDTNVFRSAHTFGGRNAALDAVLGETGKGYSNGDGVLFYPGTDLVFPADSLGLGGPMASLRIKHWRRGVQDADYLTLAAAVQPAQVQALVDQMVPKTLWEYGVTDPNDPTYVLSDISWSTDPDAWEAARLKLADIIAPRPAPPPPPPAGGDSTPPQPPASVTFNWPLTGSLRFNWEGATDDAGVAGHRFDLALDPAFTKPVSGYFNKDAGSGPWASLPNLQPGTVYYGRARAYDAAGNLSPNSATAQGATLSADYASRNAPTGLVLSNPAVDGLTAGWTPAAPSPYFQTSSYQVQASTTASFAGQGEWDGYFYTSQYTGGLLTPLRPGTLHHVRVRAVDAAGNASNYATASAWTRSNAAAAPPAPSNVAFRYPAVTTARLAWDPAPGAAGYRLDVARDAGFTAKVSGYADRNVGDVQWIDLGGLSAGVDYYARVRAYDAQGAASADSAAAWMRTLDADFASRNAPASAWFSAPSRTGARLTWTASRAVGGFTVYKYQVQLSRRYDFADFAANPWGGLFYSGTTAQLSGLTPGARYYARVRATDVHGNVSYYGPATSVLLPR